jgi:uncharacterized protein YbaP (TraB family)
MLFPDFHAREFHTRRIFVTHRFLSAVAGFALALSLASTPAFAQQNAPAPAQPAAPAAAAPAAPLPDADPALWVVRDADTTIYLFGTFHLLDGRPWFNDEIRTAFDASGELVLEAILPENPSSLQPMIMRYAVDPTGRTLSSRLTAEQNAALTRAIAPLGVPATAFDTFEPWFVSMTLAVVAVQRLGVSAANGSETVLTAAARARNIPIGELEGMEWQIRLFDTMPEAQQLTQLAQTLEEDDQLSGKLAPMLAAWSTGDVERLAALLNENSHEDPALHRMLLTDRNANWARWIRDRMARPGTVFVAVGAGHLAGDDSVQAALQAQGISAARVPHVAAN